MQKKFKGYPLPSVIDPGETVCIRAIIPNDPLYIGAWWESYRYLTTWIAWEKETTHKARDAAEVWKAAYNQAMDQYLTALGECGVMDVRQADTCKLEKTYDGLTWEEWADIWQCALQDDPTPNYPSGDGDRTGGECECDDVIFVLIILITIIHEELDRGTSEEDVVIIAGEWWRQATGGSIIGIAGVVDDMASHTSGERETAIAALQSAVEALRNEIICRTGTLHSYITHHRHWLDDLASAISDTLNESAEWLVNTLNSVAATLGWAEVKNTVNAAGGGGAGFGVGTNPDPCGLWSHSFDFITKEGWYPYDMDGDFVPAINGVHRVGEWVGTHAVNPTINMDANCFGIAIDFVETTITGIAVEAFFDDPELSPWATALNIYDGSLLPTLVTLASLTIYPFPIVIGKARIGWTGERDMTRICIDSGHGHPNHGQTGFLNRAQKVTVTGTGVNPFL